MKRNIRLYILVFTTLFFSCAEDKGNYDYQPANDVVISGIPKDTTTMHAEVLKIKPIFERSLEFSEEGLEYKWTFAGKEIGTTRDLNYTIPSSLNVGKYDCRYEVTDKKNGMKYFKNFNINIVASFSWGYYFLCEAADQSSVLSYFSTKEGTTQCLHARKVGDYPLGKRPKAMIEQFSHISVLNDYYYTFYVVAEEGDHPVIITNNGSFMPEGLISNSNFMFSGDQEFKPTEALSMMTGSIYFISNGKIYSYNSGLLYRAAKHDKEYFWSHLASVYSYVYVFDNLSKRFYILKNQINDPALGLISDSYALDRVVEIANQPSFFGHTILNQVVSREHKMYLATAETGQINLITFEYIDNKAETEESPAINEKGEVIETNTLVLASADENTKAVLVSENDWYFVVGNKVYTSPVLKPALAEFATLPEDIGIPVSVAVSSKSTQLIIATYNANSSEDNKGSFVLLDLMTKKVTVHRNVMGECVIAKGYDANPWF